MVMLKVVGASVEKTRLIVIAFALLFILGIVAIFFFEIPAKVDDGMYAATVSWSPRIGFKVEYWGQNNNPSRVPKGVARAYYQPDNHKTGWASIEIETSPKYPDWVQAFAAGILEGSLCWQLIHWHWENTIRATCNTDEEVCKKVRSYLDRVEDEARTQAKNQDDEPFWHHVNLFYYQLDGLQEGWNRGVERSRKKKEISIPDVDFLWMNSVNEIRDLKIKYNPDDTYLTQYSSLTFFKHLPNTTHQYLLAHETERSYSEMLRMHKKYTFGYHLTSAENSELVPVRNITFTSYPGAIHSQDDYYQVYVDDGSHYTIAGSNVKLNHTFLEKLDETKLHVGPRVAAAARLSRNGGQWANNVIREGRSYMGGKQWIVLDHNQTANNLSIWIAEQVPGKAMIADVTDIILEQGFWISAGTLQFEAIKDFVRIGNETDLGMQAAISMLQYSHENATSPDKLFEMMRKPELIALSRPDIIKYSDSDSGLPPKHGGIIDIKISDDSGDVLTVAGPPYSDEVEPFQWSRSILESLPHVGQPDLWKYGPVQQTWVW